MDGHALPGRLPELSNFYCLPARAGGAPLAISFTATPYQPIDTIANRKERKAGPRDRTWSTMKIVPVAIVMPSLMITVMPSLIVMG